VESKLSDVLSVVRGGRDEDRAFVAELSGLATEVKLLLAGTTEHDRARGYFALVDAAPESDINALQLEFARVAEQPFTVLSGGGAKARALAGMLLDARFRTRAAALAGLDFEVRELTRGLDVLRGANAGYVLVTQAEVSHIAARIDLAASLLRAARNDLLALRPPHDDTVEDALAAARASQLVELATAAEGENVRRAGVARECEQAAALQAAMQRTLFTVRLRDKVAPSLEWRARLFEDTAPLLVEALQNLPDTEEGRAAPAAVQALAKHERMRAAGFAATRGLAVDPLDPDLAWIAAHCVDFLHGISDSRPLYDRYLALRGIRSHDHRTYAGRTFNAREAEALDAIQRSELPQPGKSRGL
jgi:hypothetical protein